MRDWLKLLGLIVLGLVVNVAATFLFWGPLLVLILGAQEAP